MELIHTSPTEITSIHTHGRFSEFLFFSGSEYVMTAGTHFAYKIEVSDDSIIEAGRLFHHEDASKLAVLVAKLATRLGIDVDVSEALIEESVSIFDIDSNVEAEDLADTSWDIQLFTARAAKLLGFRGVEVSDEQGTSYMIDMLGRESELVKA
ncbi:hypothetical protein QN386_23835 [Pseudomonas sp. CCI3.2]|uniref:hypothetical protein n=1 Tax=unclassified Pseudomonas TaxID=196821 RepID=UPI002B22C9FC|nr:MULTISPECIES: hypothetical protein [unclassified Pseudomonas]MEB0077992.1 hypothetical protein [Pseudomonas sp. MH10out]MEB0104336.1 hypothetical protein [Pseudomonas sp. CCI3.2]MEB0132658.1 hypothetical protein [Pseudomonas sp. CCI2.4]MEB0167937.1 hypothetical protein [Pseudomonas sp. CCC4.4]